MSSTHDSDVFQSSIMSWSSKIIALGTTDSTHRSTSGCHDSWYSHVYSSKSATSSSGGNRRRPRGGHGARSTFAAGLRRRVVGVHLVADEEQQVRPLVRRLSQHPQPVGVQGVDAAARSSWSSSRFHGGSCGAAARHEPNKIRIGPAVEGADHARREPLDPAAASTVRRRGAPRTGSSSPGRGPRRSRGRSGDRRP